MRDTEPFTTSRVQVKVLALPGDPHWSPEVKGGRSGANLDESEVATSRHFFSSHTE